MTTPDKPFFDPDHQWALNQVQGILHPRTKEITPRAPIILFNFRSFKRRWNSLSIAEQYACKTLGSAFGGVALTSLGFATGDERFLLTGILGLVVGVYRGWRGKP